MWHVRVLVCVFRGISTMLDSPAYGQHVHVPFLIRRPRHLCPLLPGHALHVSRVHSIPVPWAGVVVNDKTRLREQRLDSDELQRVVPSRLQ